MEVTTYSSARTNLDVLMDRVEADCIPVAISRHGNKPVVLISMDEWEFVQSKIGGVNTIDTD